MSERSEVELSNEALEQDSTHNNSPERDDSPEMFSSQSREMIAAAVSAAEKLDLISVEESDAKFEKRYKLVVKYLKKASRIFAIAGILNLGHEFVDQQNIYTNSRYTVTTETGPSGGIRFRHEDEKTTRIIEYLAGMSELSPDDQAKMLDPKPKQRVGETDKVNMTWQGKDKIIEDNIRTRAKEMISKPEYFSEVYEALWEIEKIAGNPKIRWLHYDTLKEYDGTHRAVYDPKDNTMYIEPPVHTFHNEIIQNFAAEAAHGKQFSDPASVLVRQGYSKMLVIYNKWILSLNDFNAYDKIYETLGSLEYDAHKNIEPEFLSMEQKAEAQAKAWKLFISKRTKSESGSIGNDQNNKIQTK